MSTVFVLLALLAIPQVLLAEVTAPSETTSSTTIIHAGTLLAVPGSQPASEKTLVIVDGRVDRILDGFVEPDQVQRDGASPRLVDLRSAFVLPGLLDAHVHLLYRHGGELKNPHRSGEELLIAGVLNARLTLEAGFTTVADLDAGANSWPIIVLRDAIRAGDVPGPKLLVAASSISPTGGHGDFMNAPDSLLKQVESPGLCDGEADCRRAVRRQFRQGADLIKLHATGGGNERTGGKHHLPSFMEDEFRGIVETARSLGLHVTAHAHATAGINAALLAGVDSIQHGSFLDKQSIRLFKKNNAWLVPTLDVQDMIVDLVKTAPPHVLPRLRSYQDEHPENTRRAWQLGVKLALGSDAGVIPHGSNAREVEWLVKIGISEAEALQVATLNTAKMLGLDDSLGSLETGKNADVIAVTGNPLEDIKALRKVTFVMKDGRVFRNDR